MRLRFGPQDEAAFEAARTVLLAKLEVWLADQPGVGRDGAAEMAGDARLALDWKWGYGDGDLGLWRTDHIAEFLLDWCPRKLSVGPDECGSILAAVAALVRFLDASKLLAKGSSPARALQQGTLAMRADFVAAMGDSTKFGMAKSLFSGASADGIDLSDPRQVEGWIAEFNALPDAERHRLLPDPPPAAARMPALPALPAVAIPGDAELDASKAEAPILEMFAKLAAYVGDGRKLTAKGNLSLADARALVVLLGTGDVMDQMIGDRTFKTRSAEDLGRLRQVFAWAKKARVIRVNHGRVIATKRGLAMGGNPAAHFDRALEALLSLGPLSSQRHPDAWRSWPEVDAFLDESLPHLLMGPYVSPDPVPMDDLAGMAAEAVLSAFGFRTLTDDIVRRSVACDVVDIIDALALAGMVRRADVDPPRADGFSRLRTGGTVELTPAGVVAAQRLLVDAGYEAPVAGQFGEATATELLVGVGPLDVPNTWAEIEAWRRRRDPADALAQLAAVVEDLDQLALRYLALIVMADIDMVMAEAQVRRLRAQPSVKGLAWCWLVDHGLEPERSLLDTDDPWPFVDVLGYRMMSGGREAVVATLALAGDHDGQIAMLGKLWRAPSKATEMVLAAIGESHPVKAVAKAARKAVFQRRSWISLRP